MRYFRNGGPEAATGLRGLVLPGVGYGMRACLCAAVLGGLGYAVRARGVWLLLWAIVFWPLAM